MIVSPTEILHQMQDVLHLVIFMSTLGQWQWLNSALQKTRQKQATYFVLWGSDDKGIELGRT